MPVTKVKPLFYRPPPPWFFWTAFGVAVGIHLTAVALAQKREAVAVELPPQPPQVVEAALAPPEATPPPEDVPLPEPPPPPESKPEFVEERTPPPRPPPSAQPPKFTHINAAALWLAQAQAHAVSHPLPASSH